MVTLSTCRFPIPPNKNSHTSSLPTSTLLCSTLVCKGKKRCWKCYADQDAKLYPCPLCNIVFYCSKKCQMAAWTRHAEKCRTNSKTSEYGIAIQVMKIPPLKTEWTRIWDLITSMIRTFFVHPDHFNLVPSHQWSEFQRNPIYSPLNHPARFLHNRKHGFSISHFSQKYRALYLVEAGLSCDLFYVSQDNRIWDAQDLTVLDMLLRTGQHIQCRSVQHVNNYDLGLWMRKHSADGDTNLCFATSFFESLRHFCTSRDRVRFFDLVLDGYDLEISHIHGPSSLLALLQRGKTMRGQEIFKSLEFLPTVLQFLCISYVHTLNFVCVYSSFVKTFLSSLSWWLFGEQFLVRVFAIFAR